MIKDKIKRNVVLGILFFLPVTFLLFLLPAKHHYNPLDVVKYQVRDLKGFTSSGEKVMLKDHITVIGFLGYHPMELSVTASNVKELVYDKFKGFKKFQIVMIVPKGAEVEAEKLKSEISQYEDLKYWHFVYGNPSAISSFYDGLKSPFSLDQNLSSEEIFIVDKDLNQRGRLDDREKKEVASNKPSVELTSYNTIKISELKNKFGDDFRVLFQEYREKRKGTFESSDQRRANDLKVENE